MGESARRPGCPELPATPLDLMTANPGEGYTDFQTNFWPVCGVITGVGCIAFMNILFRRPKWAGLPLHILAGGVGYVTFSWVRDKTFGARSEDNSIAKHYISLHPEDFPPFERKRWRDVYQRFDPVR